MRTLALAVVLAAPLGATAQVTFGARAGLNASSFAPNLFAAEEARVGPAAAAFVEAPVWGGIGVRVEGVYSSEGVDFGRRPTGFEAFPEDDGGGVTADYLGAGLAATARCAVDRPALALRPFVGVQASAKVRETHATRELVSGNLSRQPSDLLAPAYASVVGGLGVERGPLGVDLRYALGLEDGFNWGSIVRVAGSPVVRPSVATVSVSYRLTR